MFKRKRLILVSLAAILLGTFAVSLGRRAYVVPIIMYHSISAGSPQNKLAVSSASFERQMRFLKTNRYNVVSLEELAGLIRQKKNLPAKTIAITFDDGYGDNHDYAFPVLKKYGLPATIFLIANKIGEPDKLTWDEARAMRESGVIRFGSHTLDHLCLVDVKSEEELKRQIFDSKKMLEGNLGLKVNTFSYPLGAFNARIRQMVIDAGYEAAAATNPGRKYPKDDLFALKRIRISSTSDNLLVFWLETSGFYTFIKERRDD